MEGYEVHGAEDGQRALDYIRENGTDILVTDNQMPHMDGYSLINSLGEEGHTFPIIMQTATKFDPNRIKYRGRVEYMSKSKTKDKDLVAKVNELLQE